MPQNTQIPQTVINDLGEQVTCQVTLNQDGKTIIFPSNMAQQCRLVHTEFANWADNIAEDKNSGRLTIPEGGIAQEVAGLMNLAERIIKEYPELNIYHYLPTTKAGTLPKGQRFMLATSKASYSAGYDGYFEKYVLGLELTPCYENLSDWLAAKVRPETLLMQLRTSNMPKPRPTVFDETGTPHKLEITRATRYLPENEIKTGDVYKEKSGTEYLVVTGIRVSHKTTFIDKDGSTSSYGPESMPNKHCYIKWSKGLAAALDNDPTVNGLVRYLASKDKYNSWMETMSQRENPRKFVKKTRDGFDPNGLTTETFASKPAKSICVPDEKVQHTYYVGEQA